MRAFEHYYTEAKIEMNVANNRTVQEQAEDLLNKDLHNPTGSQRDILTKIGNYIKRKGLDTDCKVILQKILNPDQVVASIFAKDSSKQNASEKSQMAFVRRIHQRELGKLPANGPSSMRFDEGEIVYGKAASTNATKSFDFEDKVANALICAKVTQEEGGAQKNQFNDVKHFLQEAVLFLEKNPESPRRCVALVDGSYYNEKGLIELNEGIPPELKKRIIITSSDDYAEKVPVLGA